MTEVWEAPAVPEVRYVDAALVRPGDMVPGLGRVGMVQEIGNGSHRRVCITIEDGFIIIAKNANSKIPVEREEA